LTCSCSIAFTYLVDKPLENSDDGIVRGFSQSVCWFIGAAIVGSSCYRPVAASSDADFGTDLRPPDAKAPNSDDGDLSDASVDGNLSSGDPTLSRAPRVCTTGVASSQIDAQFATWKSFSYVPDPRPVTQSFDLCNAGSDSVIASHNQYAAPAVSFENQPAFGLARSVRVAAPFRFSYVVESVNQMNDTVPTQAGGSAWSSMVDGKMGGIAIERNAGDGRYMLRAQTQGGQSGTAIIGQLQPPFRVSYAGDFSNGQFTASVTITTGTTQQMVSLQVAVPINEFQLAVATIRYEPDRQTSMTLSELILP
jgi:hypothetical protein